MKSTKSLSNLLFTLHRHVHRGTKIGNKLRMCNDRCTCTYPLLCVIEVEFGCLLNTLPEVGFLGKEWLLEECFFLVPGCLAEEVDLLDSRWFIFEVDWFAKVELSESQWPEDGGFFM